MKLLIKFEPSKMTVRRSFRYYFLVRPEGFEPPSIQLRYYRLEDGSDTGARKNNTGRPGRI